MSACAVVAEYGVGVAVYALPQPGRSMGSALHANTTRYTPMADASVFRDYIGSVGYAPHARLGTSGALC